MTTPTILALDSPDATLANAGGKGVNLARLTRAGLPVPGGFILTTAAYRAFVTANDLAPMINGQLSIANDQLGVDAASAAIRVQFAAAAMPPDLAAAILAAYHALPPALAVHRSPFTVHHSPLAVAVRSSATAEDLPDMSFAGQQDTFLHVVGDDSLLQAVVGCWSSLWTARAITYRARNDIPQEGVALAVVVQAMVESEASGVLFTANPLTGRRDETVIDATLGLGEALVSGQVEPDHYVVDTAGGRITAKTLGAKATAIRGRAGGGTVTIQGDASRQQALPDEAILDLARLGRQVASLYDQPQDMEWAWADGRLVLLQSRAITSLYPLPAGMPLHPLQVMFSLNHVQGMLDPFTPLGQDALILALMGFVKGFGRHFDLATQREAQTAGERLYVNFTPALRHGFFRPLVRGVLRYIEPSTGQALDTLLDEPELRPTTDRLSPRAAGQLLRILAPLARGLILALRRPEARRRQAQQRIEEAVAEVRRRMVEAPSLAQQLAVWESAYDIIPDVGLPLLFPVVAAGIGSFFQLRRLANKHLASDQLALEAARGLPNNVTTEMDLALWTVAQIIGRDGESRSRFRRETPAELAQDCRAGRLPVPAQAALAAFLDRYGARGLAEIDLARPRWRDDPTHIMQVVQSYLQIEDPTQAPDHVFRQGAQAAQSAIDQLVAAMPNPVEARMARLFATRMRALAGLREYPKFMIMQLMGIMRSALLKRGPELVAAGVLERPDDLFFLRFAELKALAAGDASSDGRVWRGLVAERRQRYEREMRRNQVPRLLLSDGRAFYAGMTGDGGEAGDTMSGSPVSPGVVEGTVRVVFDPHDAQLAPGEILVCPGTDPSWTPLFLAAGGLVMEVGGLMTHGSVVAREYGIPAVVGVHRATERLHTGQRVRVDGSSGRIELLDGQGA